MLTDISRSLVLAPYEHEYFKQTSVRVCDNEQIGIDYLGPFQEDLSPEEPSAAEHFRRTDGGGMEDACLGAHGGMENAVCNGGLASTGLQTSRMEEETYCAGLVDFLVQSDAGEADDAVLNTAEYDLYLQDESGEDSRGSVRSSCIGFDPPGPSPPEEMPPVDLKRRGGRMEEQGLEKRPGRREQRGPEKRVGRLDEQGGEKRPGRLEEQGDEREAKVQAVLDSALDWLLLPFEAPGAEKVADLLVGDVQPWLGDEVVERSSWQDGKDEENGSNWSLQFPEDHLSCDGTREGVGEAVDGSHGGLFLPVQAEEEERCRKPLYHFSSSSSIVRWDGTATPAAAAETPPKRKRGRPKGSGKKKDVLSVEGPPVNRSCSVVQNSSARTSGAEVRSAQVYGDAPMQKRKRGRPAKHPKGGVIAEGVHETAADTICEDLKCVDDVAVSGVTNVQKSSGGSGSFSVNRVEHSVEKRGRGRPRKKGWKPPEEDVWSDSQASDSDWDAPALEVESTDRPPVAWSRAGGSGEQRKTARPRGRPPKNRKPMQEVLTESYRAEHSPKGNAPQVPVIGFGLEGSGLDEMLVGSLLEVSSGTQPASGDERVLSSPPEADTPQKRKRGRPPKNPKGGQAGPPAGENPPGPGDKLRAPTAKGGRPSASVKKHGSPRIASADCGSAEAGNSDGVASAEFVDDYD